MRSCLLVSIFVPIETELEPFSSILPKPPTIEPEERAPTEVSDEFTTDEPSVEASSILVLFMRKALPVDMFMFSVNVTPP